jgi:hypothetical protein
MDTYVFEVQLKKNGSKTVLRETGHSCTAAETTLKSKHKIFKVLMRRREIDSLKIL